jgi:hypothetical protein
MNTLDLTHESATFYQKNKILRLQIHVRCVRPKYIICILTNQSTFSLCLEHEQILYNFIKKVAQPEFARCFTNCMWPSSDITYLDSKFTDFPCYKLMSVFKNIKIISTIISVCK